MASCLGGAVSAPRLDQVGLPGAGAAECAFIIRTEAERCALAVCDGHVIFSEHLYGRLVGSLEDADFGG